MSQITSDWRSPDGVKNAAHLWARHADAFSALAEVDALGHRLLTRAASAPTHSIDNLVGIAFLRRSVTLVVGTRTLLEASAVDAAKLTLRAQFELMLATRHLVHGAVRTVDLHTPTSHNRRESRARYFMAASLRGRIYRRQAVLDHAWGRQPVGTDRSGVQDEIKDYLDRLRRYCPAQHKRFGPLRCYRTGSAKRHYHDDRQWFSFGFRRSSNINSIRALAGRLGKLRDYEVVYSALSGMTHPRGIGHDLVVNDGSVDILSPHMPDAFDLICFFGIGYAAVTLLWLAKAYHRPSVADARAVSLKVNALTKSLSRHLPVGFVE